MFNRLAQTSSNDGHSKEPPVGLSNPAQLDDVFRSRSNDTVANQSDSSDESTSRSRESLNFEEYQSGDSADEEKHMRKSASATMGELVANSLRGPYNRRRRPSDLPLDLGKNQHLKEVQSAVSKEKSLDPESGIKRRMNKHAPVEEQISRRPVSVFRDAVKRKSVKSLDPRFHPKNNSQSQQESDLARRYRLFARPASYDSLPEVSYEHVGQWLGISFVTSCQCAHRIICTRASRSASNQPFIERHAKRCSLLALPGSHIRSGGKIVGLGC